MIIFALEGVLANDDHRKHLIYPNYSHGFEDLYHTKLFYEQIRPGVSHSWYEWIHKFNGTIWRPDYEAYYDACDNDEPIEPLIKTIRRHSQYEDIQIWCDGCESVRNKTIDWILKFVPLLGPDDWLNNILKMRPKGDVRLDWQLKEEWIDNHIANGGKPIEMVFESDPESIAMFRRKKIFVFDCRQDKE